MSKGKKKKRKPETTKPGSAAPGSAAPGSADGAIPRPSGPRLHLNELSYELTKGVVQLETPCTLEAGSIYLIEGASGIGKSSLARTLLGLGACTSPPLPSHGDVKLTGLPPGHGQGGGGKEDVAHESVDQAGGGKAASPRGAPSDTREQVVLDGRGYRTRARRHLGFLPQLNALAFIDDLSPMANLGLYSGLGRRRAQEEIEGLARRFDIWPLPPNLARASGGERMRLSSVRALLPRSRKEGAPSVLLADEPTVGLDLGMARQVAGRLIDVARGGQQIVAVISHDPGLFLRAGADRPPVEPGTIRITRCRPLEGGAVPEEVVGVLRLQPRARPVRRALAERISGICDSIGGFVLSPLAFLYGLVRMDRHSARAGTLSVLRTAFNASTWIFVAAAAIVVGTTLSFFAFQKMPKREILEPLFLPEFLREFGLGMILVLPPLFAALFSTAKTGAAQAARLASAVRSGLHETLALARIQPESFALVPAVLGQTLCLFVTTALAMALALGSSAIVFLATGTPLSLDLALEMMLAALDKEPDWLPWLVAKTATSGAAGGVIAALFGLRPSRGAESDVSLAVHRTLLWTLLAVLAIQCGFVIAQFG